MKTAITILIATTCISLALAQAPDPQLSTSQQIALTALLKDRQQAIEAQKQAQENIIKVEREFQSEHPGWRLNQFTYAPEKEVQPAAAPAPKPVPPQKK